jgi:KaiC/GvpD/RAD55 family RecA-like ATPase
VIVEASKNGAGGPAPHRRRRRARRVEPDRLLPHNALAERCLVGAPLCLGEYERKTAEAAELVRRIATVTCSADFYLPREGMVFRALEELVEDGVAITHASVIERLATYQEAQTTFRACEPETFLLGEVSGNFLTEPGPLLHHAHTVAQHARHREALERASDLVQALKDGHLDRAAELAKGVATELEPPVETAAPLCRPLTELGQLVGSNPTRLTTGVATLDAATRGGIPVSKVVVVGGAPGAGKTTFLLQLGHAWARDGVQVTFLAGDEELEGLLVRVGQLEGLDRDLLERGDPETMALFQERLAELEPTLSFVDGDELGGTVNAAAEDLARRAAGGPSVLIIDSVQTVRADGADLLEDRRAKVDLVMAAMKRAAHVHRHLVLATCELARGAYRSTNAAERIDDLAAFKESGGIEYAASLAVVLRSVKDGGGLVDGTIPKSRIGTKQPFRLSLDGQRARFVEVAIEDPDSGEAIVERETNALDEAKSRILAVLRKAIQPLRSKGEIQRRAKVQRSRCWVALNELLEQGEVVILDGAFRAKKDPAGGAL